MLLTLGQHLELLAQTQDGLLRGIAAAGAGLSGEPVVPPPGHDRWGCESMGGVLMAELGGVVEGKAWRAGRGDAGKDGECRSRLEGQGQRHSGAARSVVRMTKRASSEGSRGLKVVSGCHITHLGG
jgi:hypothetical protein